MAWGLNSKTSYPLGTRPAGTKQTPALTGTIKVMAVGDSLTVGLGDPVSNAWRKNLDSLASGQGLTLDWVGSVSHGNNTDTNPCQAFSGSTTLDHAAAGTYDSPAEVTTYEPDVVIVLLGTNDANNDTLTTDFDTNYPALMNELDAAHAGIRFVVCNLPDAGDQNDLTTGRPKNVPLINAEIESLWDTLEGTDGLTISRANVRVLEHWTDYYRSEGGGAVHPSVNGYIKLAQAIYPAFMNACGYDAEW